MRSLLCFTVAMMLLVSTGCSSSVSGTWVADRSAGTDNPIAAATFCHDGTFTANASYGGGKSRAMSGHYSISGDSIEFESEGEVRSYVVTIGADEMSLSHDGKSYKMVRMQPR